MNLIHWILFTLTYYHLSLAQSEYANSLNKYIYEYLVRRYHGEVAIINKGNLFSKIFNKEQEKQYNLKLHFDIQDIRNIEPSGSNVNVYINLNYNNIPTLKISGDINQLNIIRGLKEFTIIINDYFNANLEAIYTTPSVPLPPILEIIDFNSLIGRSGSIKFKMDATMLYTNNNDNTISLTYNGVKITGTSNNFEFNTMYNQNWVIIKDVSFIKVEKMESNIDWLNLQKTYPNQFEINVPAEYFVMKDSQHKFIITLENVRLIGDKNQIMITNNGNNILLKIQDFKSVQIINFDIKQDIIKQNQLDLSKLDYINGRIQLILDDFNFKLINEDFYYITVQINNYQFKTIKNNMVIGQSGIGKVMISIIDTKQVDINLVQNNNNNLINGLLIISNAPNSYSGQYIFNNLLYLKEASNEVTNPPAPNINLEDLLNCEYDFTLFEKRKQPATVMYNILEQLDNLDNTITLKVCNKRLTLLKEHFSISRFNSTANILNLLQPFMINYVPDDKDFIIKHELESLNTYTMPIEINVESDNINTYINNDSIEVIIDGYKLNAKKDNLSLVKGASNFNIFIKDPTNVIVIKV